MWCFKNYFYLCVLFLPIFISHGFDLGWKCESDDDCITTNSSCNKNICMCESGYVFNSNLTACLKVATSYGDLCEDTVQCSPYLWVGALCEIEKNRRTIKKPEKTTCVCGKGYHYLHGRCYRSSGLGDKCKSDDDCYLNSDFEAASCKNGTCICSDGFYQREYRTCRRAANAAGEECTINLDCRFNKNAKCTNFKCELGKNSRFLLHEFEKVHVKKNNTFDLESECKRDEECEKDNMICGPESKCICKRAHFNFIGECIPELGEPCSASEFSINKDFVCRNGMWNCITGKVASKNNKLCKKVTRKYNYSCILDEQCYIFGPDAFCSSKKCLCSDNSHYIKEEQFCWINKGIGESCESNNDCYIHGSKFKLSCTNSTCSCPVGTIPNSEETLCIKIPTGINATCEKSKDCLVNNGDCISNTCSCIKDYIPLSEDNCVKISSYGEKCDHHIQCNATLTNGTCLPVKDIAEGNNSTWSICTCANNYHYINGNCFVKKFLGDRCQNQSECYLDNHINRVTCTNGICSCDLGYKKLGDRICTKNGSPAIYLPIWIGLMIAIFNLLVL